MGRKGSCTNHMRDVAALLHGHHVTVHARDEDEVDEQAILEKLARAGSSAYNFRQRSTETSPQSKPVVSSLAVQGIGENGESHSVWWELDIEACCS